jgi:glycerate 2-kinase
MCDSHDMTLRALQRSFSVESSESVSISVVAAGKASRGMLEALRAFDRVRVREMVVAQGGHPLPDAASVQAARDALRLASAARARGEALIVLLSGGASAMLEMPADGISLEDVVLLTKLLLASGMPIAQMNAVRKHLSAIKGGQLAAAAGSTVTLAISDVHAPVADDPASIGSGPTVADPSTFADVERALREVELIERVPAAVRDRIVRGVRGEVPETPKPGDSRLSRARFVLAGSREDAMDGACAEANARGFRVVRIAEPTLGEAEEAARRFLAVVGNAGMHRERACVVASGETTVTIGERHGRGGRNQEFALAAASGLEALGTCALASVGTDGVDGPTDAAGAIVDSTTASRARALGIDIAGALALHDAYPALQRLGDLVVTGPTGTNVGDLQVWVGSGL